jgi:hypothetical protein
MTATANQSKTGKSRNMRRQYAAQQQLRRAMTTTAAACGRKNIFAGVSVRPEMPRRMTPATSKPQVLRLRLSQ